MTTLLLNSLIELLRTAALQVVVGIVALGAMHVAVTTVKRLIAFVR